MTKKDRRAISNGIAAIYLIVALYLYWMVFNGKSIYWLLGIVFSTVAVKEIIYSILPSTKSKKKGTRKGKSKKKGLNNSSPYQLRSDREIIATPLEGLSWREFERLCFLYFKAKGYNPSETGGGADGGVDLVLYNRYHKAKEAVQIKHYIQSGNQITVQQVRVLNSAKRNHRCMLTRFITTSRFTRDALLEAEKYHMTCYDIDWVKNKLVKWQEQEREKAG